MFHSFHVYIHTSTIDLWLIIGHCFRNCSPPKAERMGGGRVLLGVEYGGDSKSAHQLEIQPFTAIPALNHLEAKLSLPHNILEGILRDVGECHQDQHTAD